MFVSVPAMPTPVTVLLLVLKTIVAEALLLRSRVFRPPPPSRLPVSVPAFWIRKVSLPRPPVRLPTPDRVVTLTPSDSVPLSGPVMLKVDDVAVPTSVVPTPLPVTVSLPAVALTTSVRPPVHPDASIVLLPLPPVKVADDMLARVTGPATERLRRALASVKFSLAAAVVASELAAPVPPSMLPRAKPVPSTKLSAAVPPTRLGTPLKVVVPTPSLTVPALAALTV